MLALEKFSSVWNEVGWTKIGSSTPNLVSAYEERNNVDAGNMN